MGDNFFKKWLKGLDKTRKVTFSRLASIFGTNEITNNTWDELEELFIQADAGVETTESIIESLKKTARSEGFTKADELTEALQTELRNRLKTPDDPMKMIETAKPPGYAHSETMRFPSSIITTSCPVKLLPSSDRAKTATPVVLVQ